MFALRQADTGITVAEVCRKMGISEATYYNWKKKYGGLGVPELRRLRQLEEENQPVGPIKRTAETTLFCASACVNWPKCGFVTAVSASTSYYAARDGPIIINACIDFIAWKA